MGFKKHASFAVTSAVLVPVDATPRQAEARIRRQGHRAVFDYEPRAGYLYVRSRAISSRCNDNFDEFPAEEIKKAYSTFIGKPVFVNHNNDNHRRMRGVIIDAALHEDRNRDGTPDTWAEVLMEVDAVRFPRLAKAILAGEIDRTSMGTDVAFSVCSACHNKASNPSEYCQHIPRLKGKRIERRHATTGAKESVLIREICSGLSFFENSLLVEEPADPTAYFTGIDQRGMSATAAKTAGDVHDLASQRAKPRPGQKTCPECEGTGLDYDEYWGCDNCGGEGKVNSDGSQIKQGASRASVRPADALGAATGTRIRSTASQGRTEAFRTASSDDDLEYQEALSELEHVLRKDNPHLPSGSVMNAADKALEHKRHAPGTFERHVDDQMRTKAAQSPRTAIEIHLSDADREMFQQAHERGLQHREIADHTHRRVVDLSDPADLQSHLQSEHGWDENDSWRNSHPEDHPGMEPGTDDDRPLAHAEMRGAHEHEHTVLYPDDHPHAITMGDDHFHGAGHQATAAMRGDFAFHAVDYTGTDIMPAWAQRPTGGSDSAIGGVCPKCHHDLDRHSNRGGDVMRCGHCSCTTTMGHEPITGMLFYEAKGKKIEDMSPAELVAHRASEAEGKKWNVDHPATHQNVVDHWNQATPDEKSQGENWYADAHNLTKHVANDTKTPMHTAAGLMSNYSPQTHWATNMMNAARVMRTKVGIGGKGSGVFASKGQKNTADRLVGGEHYDTVLGGPKTHAFAHLIEHGGNADPSKPKVVVDRHALSVAAGSRASDMAYTKSGLGGKKRYQQVSDAYHEAAKHISAQEGRTVEPHQVQAATWLVRQRLNEEHDRALSKTAGSRSARAAKKAIATWNTYAGEHHPEALGKEPGTGYSKDVPKDAPEDVQHASEMAKQNEPVAKTATFIRLAYGETVAPADIDTLAPDTCPICGEADSYDGMQCQVCQYVAPPQIFRDPDLDLAKQIDLRKDTLEDAGQVPGDPGAADPNAVDPNALGPDGQPLTDPNAVDPNALGPDGQPLPGDPNAVNPDALDADGNVIPGDGDPALNGEGDPTEPESQDGAPVPGEPMGDDSLDEALDEQPDPNDVDPEDLSADGQTPIPQPGAGDPGTPEDGVPDLMCPNCGYETDAQQPTSTTMDASALPEDAGDGTMAGDVCPNCGEATMLSVADMQDLQQAQQQPQPQQMP